MGIPRAYGPLGAENLLYVVGITVGETTITWPSARDIQTLPLNQITISPLEERWYKCKSPPDSKRTHCGPAWQGGQPLPAGALQPGRAGPGLRRSGLAGAGFVDDAVFARRDADVAAVGHLRAVGRRGAVPDPHDAGGDTLAPRQVAAARIVARLSKVQSFILLVFFVFVLGSM